MPITPLHLGPGLAIKAALGHRFSFLSFGIAQAAIDIEPVLAIVFGWEVLHGWTHTYAGATLIALMVMPFVRPPGLWVLRRFNRELGYHHLEWLRSPESIGWGPIAAGAFIGTWSHVAIDSIMHPDMRPFAPLSGANPSLDAIPLAWLDLSCLGAGILGLAAWILVALRRRPRDGTTSG